MSQTIQHRIVNLFSERLRDALIAGFQGFIPVDADDKQTLMDKADIGGTFTGLYPRKFEIEVVSTTATGGVIHILETTLWADLYQTHPAAFDDDVSFTFDTPLEIAGSGVTISLASTVESGDKWVMRCGNASSTVVNIVPNVVDFDDAQTPFVTVYATNDDETQVVQSKTDHELSIVVVLVVSNEEFESGIGYEIVGDIRDCINRDRALYDNDICLSTDCSVISSGIFDASKVTGKTTFKIDCTVRYRTQYNNSRSR